MRAIPGLLASAGIIALSVSPPSAAHAASYAKFRVSVSGTQTSQVSGTAGCDDDAGTIVPVHATQTVHFASARPRTLLISHIAGTTTITPTSGAGAATLPASGSLTQTSDLGPPPAACPGAPAPAACPSATLRRLTLLLQGGRGDVTVQTQRGTRASSCAVPAPFSFPELVGPNDDGSGSHIGYHAHIPSGLLSSSRTSFSIHGTGRATLTQHDGAGQTTGTTTLRFTLKVARIH